MAEHSLEQMMQDEYKRVTSGRTELKKESGLLQEVRTTARAAKVPAAEVSTAAAGKPALTGLISEAPKTPQPAAPALPIPAFADSVQGAAASNPILSAAKVLTASSSGAVNRDYTQPATQTPQPAPSSGGSVAGGIGQTALKVLTSGLGLMPVVSGLVGLFGGGGSTTPAPLTRYAMPRPIQIQAANSRNGALSFADYGQDGTVRAFDGPAASPAGPSANPGQDPAAGPTAGSAAPQIVVNVQAMDSRSFLDHSQEIAQAVREAMLNMHALNDVVSEL